MPAAVGTTPAPAATGAAFPAPASPAPASPLATAGGAPGNAGNALGLGTYNQALGDLNSALQSSNNLYSGAQAGLQSQLAQNQGNVQQNLTNTGLGNSTVAQTMQQAPLQTYNQGMLNLANAQQQANTGIYSNAAQMANSGAGQTAQITSNTNLANAQAALQAAMANQQNGADTSQGIEGNPSMGYDYYKNIAKIGVSGAAA